jgi:hypothetical protein
MIELACLCGTIRVALAKRPDFVHECNCTLCRKTGARWGYFHPSEVSCDGQTKSVCRTDKAVASAEVHFCPDCGSTTHFVLTPAVVATHGNSMMGVNMALAPEHDLAGVELRFPDGAGWSGDGPFDYLRAPRRLG